MKKQHGYFIVSVGKKGTWTFYLWGETIEELQPWVTGKKLVVPYYKEGDKRYIKHNGTFLRCK